MAETGSGSTERSSDRRKLVAVMYADMVGYSRLIGLDDAGTLDRLRTLRTNLIDPAIKEHGGRVVQTGGDSLLIVFDSIDGAVRCAVAVQQQVPIHDADQPADRTILFRIGINIGDAIADGTDLHGDAVNVAARLQAECPPGGICVTRPVRDHVQDRLDLVFEELGALNLKNIARPVEAFVVKLDAAVNLLNPTARRPVDNVHEALPLPDKPSIAVLPFQNMSGDPEQEYFVDGMAEEIITALSRIRWLFVIARNSSFTYKGKNIGAKQVGLDLGVRYILEGSVRKAGGRVRITVQLLAADAGTHLWADRFDGSLDDVFELQDKVAFSVAGVIESTLQVAEIRRASDRPRTDLTTYDLYLRAMPDCLSWDKERIQSALNLLKQGIERDPGFGPALALAAVCHHHFTTIGGVGNPETHRREALGYARRALQASPSDPGTIANVAFMLGYFEEDIAPAIALIDRALGLNPSFYRGWGASGWLRLWAGELDVGVEHLQTAIRLSPLYGNATQLYGIAVARFFERRFDTAIAAFLTASSELPGHAGIYRYLASCYAQAGRLEDAREIIKRLRTITPNVLPNVVQWRRPEHREFFLSGLRLAAGEAA